MSISAAYILPHPPVLLPEVGKGREKEIQKTIQSYHYAAQQIGALKPETVIVISPHSSMYADYFHISPGKGAEGDLKRFGASISINAEYDRLLVEEIARLCGLENFPAGTLGEKDPGLDHGTLIPLYFLNKYHSNYRLVRCSISGLPRREHYKFGTLLRQAVDMLSRDAVIIASGDLSHKLTTDGPYGFAPEGPDLDSQLVEIMKSANFGDFFGLDPTLCERGAECGLASFIIMAGAFDQCDVKPDFLSYEGPFGVGYAVCGFTVLGNDPGRDFLARDLRESSRKASPPRKGEDAYIRLAREALEYYIINAEPLPIPGDLPDDLKNTKAGAFVSIKKDGRLRGCIGTTEPTKPNLAQEIINNAVSSGTRDPRFSPVKASELPCLSYSVDVLTPARPVTDKTMLDPKRFGVIVAKGYRRGLLLPDLEGVDTVEEQIRIACQKAEIGEHEDYQLEYFEVMRHL